MLGAPRAPLAIRPLPDSQVLTRGTPPRKKGCWPAKPGLPALKGQAALVLSSGQTEHFAVLDVAKAGDLVASLSFTAEPSSTLLGWRA